MPCNHDDKSFIHDSATQEAITKLIEDFIPAPLLQHVNKSKVSPVVIHNGVINVPTVLKNLLENSNNQLRMYGNSHDLLGHLLTYTKFSLKHKKFGIPRNYLEYKEEVTKYDSSKGGLFICKQDFILHLHARVNLKYEEHNRTPSPTLVEFMTKNEDHLENSYEFGRYDVKMYDEMKETIEKMVKNTWGTRSLDTEILRKFIDAHPKYFLTNSEQNSQDIPTVARIFKDGPHSFIMLAEIEKDEETKEMTKICTDIDRIETIEEKKAYDKNLDIDFICVPIQRAKHAAVPIVTPAGSHCILISDCILELLRRLISVLRIFQTFNKQTSKKLDEVMDSLKPIINSEETSVYFVETKFLDDKKKWLDLHFSEIKRSKLVRDVGQFGFTLDFLRKELELLRLTNAFPDIMDHTKRVYDMVFKQREGQFLRTCDLIDAVDQCQLACLLNKFPRLKEFLHNQKACHRIAYLDCEKCLASTPGKVPTVDEKNDWRVYQYNDVRIRYPKCGIPQSIEALMDLPSGTSVVSNLDILPKEQHTQTHTKYFLFDLNDVNELPKNKLYESLLSHAKFLKNLPNKKVYIRTIPVETIPHVFRSESFEILLILSKQQNIPLPEHIVRQAEADMKGNFGSDQDYLSSLYPLEKFLENLEDFGIDKQSATIIPDILYKCSKNRMSEENGENFISVFNPDGKKVMSCGQAVFNVFQSLVCRMKFRFRDPCMFHKDCLKHYEKKVIDIMQMLGNNDETTFVHVAHIEDSINTMRSHCNYVTQSRFRLLDHRLLNMLPTDQIPAEYYYFLAEMFGLPKQVANFPSAGSETNVWIYNLMYIVGWAEVVFDKPGLEHLSLLVRKTAVHIIPEELIEKEYDLIKKILNLSVLPKIYSANSDSKNNDDMTSVDVKKENNYSKNVVSAEEESNDSGAPEVDGDGIKKQESCPKCLDNEKLCEEIRTRMETLVNEHKINLQKTAEAGQSLEHFKREKEIFDKKNTLEMQKLTEKYEKKVLRCDELELEMKKMEDNNREENQKLVEKVESKENQVNELERKMKKMERDLKGNEKKIKFLEKKLTDKDKELDQLKTGKSKLAMEKNRTIENLKREVTDSAEKLKQLELAMSTLQVSEAKAREVNNELNQKLTQDFLRFEEIEKEISEKNQTIEKLEKARMESSLDNEKSKKEIQNTISIFEQQLQTLHRMTGSSSEEDPYSPQIPSREESEGFRAQLWKLQKIKESMDRGDEIEQAKEMMRKMISLSENPEIDLFAAYEFQQYEGKIQNYTQLVEVNIQKLKKTREVSELSPLPDFPAFSDKFVSELWLGIKKKQEIEIKKREEIEVRDSECYFCAEEMKQDEKTLQCEHCKKVTHHKCAATWLKIHRSCAHCRQNQLDPMEFPTL
ncbi:hypothetical protein GCK72_005009 [Caenorhabditis remanei]|uniref:RING-type domain-containing protein n=1 Tax=Caenorhabditis remanei TaxID=31234 RepID=A0A6A5HBA2_CAERE|nr:hypothetical protein GCK72_005009 [Caenorhabditis remanei]KAF1765058.1 hypothetical protein GCK72_005009 [Caenorhabditis remanei]